MIDPLGRHAKARSAPYKLADQGGLYLYVSPFGAKSWRYDYRLNGKRETLTIGKYPNVSLVEARGMHAKALGLSKGYQSNTRQALRESGTRQHWKHLPSHCRRMVQSSSAAPFKELESINKALAREKAVSGDRQ